MHLMAYIEVNTRAGRLRGVEVDGLLRFLGVSYGQDTSGTNRFHPPVPVEPWVGLRDALSFGPAAPQPDSPAEGEGDAARLEWLMHPHGGSALEGGPTSEDCLRLNIWAPAERSELHPVIVWLHGGGFTSGTGNELWYNGDVLASAEQLVVVTVTHRLGILGFLDLRADEVGGVAGSANAGLLDLVEALRWVQENISEFGGDPANVTIAGQSGGSGKVAALSAMPAAQDLFTRAIMQSGPIRRFATGDESTAVRDRVLSAMGATGLADLQALPVGALMEGQRAALTADMVSMESLSLEIVPGLAPSLDPIDLPQNPFAGDPSAAMSGRDLMIGWTDHEITSLLAGSPIFTADMTAQQAIGMLDYAAPGHGSESYAHLCSIAPDEPPHLLWTRALTNATFRDPSLGIAEIVSDRGGRVWAYNFQQKTDVLEGLLGSCHSLDIPFVFGTLHRIPLVGQAANLESLSREMMHAWATFARDGVPAVTGGWTEWRRDAPAVHTFSVAALAEQGAVASNETTALRQ